MASEISDITEFFAAHRPFDALARETLLAIAEKTTVIYRRRGAQILKAGERNNSFFMIRSGAVDVKDADGNPIATVAEGDYYAFSSLLRDGVTRYSCSAREDSLLYCLSADDFTALCQRHHAIETYFATAEADRLRHALGHVNRDISPEKTELVSARLGDLIKRPDLITVARNAPAQAAARLMAQHHISTLMIHEPGDTGSIVGILTDKDIRGRLVAAGLDYATPVEEIMTSRPVMLPAGTQAFEALLVMTRRNIHHIPVTEDDRVIGMVSANDILARVSSSAIYLAAGIEDASSIKTIKETVRDLPKSLVSLADTGMAPREMGHFLSSVGEAAHRRLAELAERSLLETHGPPPVNYALMVFGSLARQDQTAKSDQDNAFIFDDAYDEAEHGAYFAALAEAISRHLNEAGYVYCPGDIMVTNPKWRKSLSGWRAQFAQWIEKPEPKAVMHTTIFYDMRAVHGDFELVNELQRDVLDRVGENRLFLGFLAGDALRSRPPRGFFRQLVILADRKHDDRYDLKHQGVVPITDIARVYALSGGIKAVNSWDRLDAIERQDILNSRRVREIRDALDFIAHVRLRHQANAIRHNRKADNLIAPKELSRFDRDHLKDAFSIIEAAQESLARTFTGGQY